jgi:glycerol-3-phosphate acyltransferase PlsY
MSAGWLALAYLIGALPIGLAVARLYGVDIRRQGSGNIGATNVLRTLGRGPAILTLAADVGKGYVGSWVGAHAGPEPAYVTLATVVPVVGNCWSVFLGFQGGRGVATGLGAFLRQAPWALVPALVAWLLLVASFRFVSLGSICAAAGLPLAVWLFGYGGPTTLAAVAVAVIVTVRHRDNLARLLAGTERRLGER